MFWRIGKEELFGQVVKEVRKSGLKGRSCDRKVGEEVGKGIARKGCRLGEENGSYGEIGGKERVTRDKEEERFVILT